MAAALNVDVTGPVTMGTVFRLWLPLAASWALMGAEGPTISAFIGNLPDEIAMLGGFGAAFALALVVEGPIIMLLAASTALCGDLESYRKVRRFMWAAAVALTAVHAAIAFTPLYDFIAQRIFDLPAEMVEPGRVGLQLLTPWTGCIAYRRFQQGLLIRFGRSKLVMVGTMLRLLTLVTVLPLCGWVFGLSGVASGTLAMSVAVLVEALFSGWAAAPVVREILPGQPPAETPLHRRGFLAFYIPLAMTPLLTLLIQPAGQAAMTRMPNADLSLAAWPAVHGLVFLVRSTGFAFNEVVVALLARPDAKPALRRFTWVLGGSTMALLALLALSPLGGLWFQGVSSFGDELAGVAATALLFTMLMPGYQALQSWFQGRLVYSRQTRGVTEAVAIYSILALCGLRLVTWMDRWTGIYAAGTVFTCCGLLQTFWLARRARQHG